MTTDYALTWDRQTYAGRAPSTYSTEAPINGEPRAFRADVHRTARGWTARVTTYGRPLETIERPTLADVRAAVGYTYRTVESVNR